MVLYWSGGKDCAMALHEISTSQRYRDYRVASLLTTFTEGFDRVSGHGVRRSLVERQAESIGLDLLQTFIPQQANMLQYEMVMERALRAQKGQGTDVAASGDIFVEKQRMAIFKKVGMNGCFPLCRRNSRRQAEELIGLGFKALVVCVDSTVLDASFAGRLVDENFLRDLPTGVDPCGEHGEFHTFAFGGPIFSRQVQFRLGETVLRQGFYFCDLVPEDGFEPRV
ncbi:MAG TPA: ATP-binding protein [Thermoanaerobaculia bacterium]